MMAPVEIGAGGGVRTCQIDIAADTSTDGGDDESVEQQKQQQLNVASGASSLHTKTETPEAENSDKKRNETRKNSSISSSTSSVLTNSIASPSSSLTSILTSSPTSTTEFSSASLNKFHQLNSELGPSSAPTAAAAAAAVPGGADLCNSDNAPLAHETPQLEQPQRLIIEQEALPMEPSATLSHPVVAQHENSGPIVLLGPMSELEQQQQLNDAAPQGQSLEQTATTTVDLLASTVGAIDEAPQLGFLDHPIGAAATDLESHQTLIEDQSRGLSSDQPTFDCCQETTAAHVNRLERSNSCSQAECSQLAQDSLSTIAHLNNTTSVSHENLTSTTDQQDSLAQFSASHPIQVDDDVNAGATAAQPRNRSPTQPIDIINSSSAGGSHRNTASSSAAGSPSSVRDDPQPQYSSSYKEKSSFLQSKPQLQQQQRQEQLKQPQLQQQPAASSSFASTSSRFFSSKLNTGSLWSLLSAGSSSSSIMNDQAVDHQNQSFGDLSCSQQCESSKQQSSAANNMQEMAALVASKSSSLLNRYHNQFKLNKQSSSTSSTSSSFDHCSSHVVNSNAQHKTPANVDQQLDRRRYRFSVKYIGSALLHRNFTLPMLEWIAKDIRRQTIRGAQSTTQRQFTIPSREIILELQFNQLTAISCKDSHCLFVHPMHCVSKYVQLQHDATCFAYIIRDNKDSPSFCHVFQAKSTSKIHEIFSAIREVATRSQIQTINRNQQSEQSGNSNRLQKSASTDGHWRSLLTNTGEMSSLSIGPKSPPISSQPKAPPSPPPLPPPTATAALYLRQQQQLQQQQAAQSLHFDNSYQFEVMFVKRVKLQCRRVPPTFVDDALETLKSFEVLKGNHHHMIESKSAQIKGSLVSKRIINASVDERQEYDESCQSPTATSAQSIQSVKPAKVAETSVTSVPTDRRASDSLAFKKDNENERKLDEHQNSSQTNAAGKDGDQTIQRKHSTSIDCLKSLDAVVVKAAAINGGQQQPPPAYANDFSPYNTITSSDLNERIAAIPVVSSSVSLDHETRQKLARQVRETIQATAANIKRGVYASGEKLDSSTSSKALESLSCNVVSSVPSVDYANETASLSPEQQAGEAGELDNERQSPKQQQQRRDQAAADVKQSIATAAENSDEVDCHRRSSACAIGLHNQQHQQVAGNNFDLFRRASARQVVKNRTMLLLIGKDELCAISIDKHQMLFSKSFNSIVHCLQGSSNRDHFGLICRDSGKINPNTESYAGYVFRCQSDKVVREIMGALKQVIYSSQHNYHGYNSPYNPLNLVASRQAFIGAAAVAAQTAKQAPVKSEARQPTPAGTSTKNEPSLAAKRGFANPIELDQAARLLPVSTAPMTPSTVSLAQARAQPPTAPPIITQPPQFVPPAKNLIKSMFCDNCPLYWYHRLCCDVESLPAEASKAIILRRIDSSQSEKEQDEVYSRFSEFNIESVEEHNEIFMSLLRQQCERKQTKHGQTQAHATAMAKNASIARQMSNSSIESNRSLSATREAAGSSTAETSNRPFVQQHQRSDSSSGSLAQLLGGGAAALSQQQQQNSLADASSLAIDNLKRAKNSISVSIENMLKRRSSAKDEHEAEYQQLTNQLSGAGQLPTRSGSFKSPQGRESRSSSGHHQDPQLESDDSTASNTSSLKRSQSTSDYSYTNSAGASAQRVPAATWRDSLSRTINESATDLTANSLVGFFRRRSSMSRDNQNQQDLRTTMSTGASRESLCATDGKQALLEPSVSRDSRSQSPSRLAVNPSPQMVEGGTSSPSSMLSGVFWKKSIFDKIRQPIAATSSAIDTQSKTTTNSNHHRAGNDDTHRPATTATTGHQQTQSVRRTREELRSLWRKAILEQITLLKMDKQNQKLQAKATAPHPRNSAAQVNPVDECCNIQRVKLNYRDVSFGKDAPKLWNRLLKQDPTKKVDFIEVARLVRLGVPKARRGEVWMFLMNQYQLRHGTSFQPSDRDYHGDANQTYRSLLTQLSTQQHEIFVDIGRTFPSHPYYSQYLSIGQLSLFNLLKAYSLLDREVGYCQGLSFVAGILLLHVDSEDEAFELMRHLLFNFGLRKQYLPSMNALHLQLYQMTRLLRDHEYDLFAHFDHHDISPSLYAAPWFLTLFASQFPLGFVARLLDLIFLIGIEAIFRISLKLLAYHRNSILACKCLEATMEFMRSELIKINDKDMADLFDKSMSLDLRNKLIEYEIEYSFYCAEDKARMVNNTTRSTQIGKPKATTNDEKPDRKDDSELHKSSDVADATATVIIQHLLANNHLRSLKTDYSY